MLGGGDFDKKSPSTQKTADFDGQTRQNQPFLMMHMNRISDLP
jgi:hypothetical protein